jgi:hypothetical protein
MRAIDSARARVRTVGGPGRYFGTRIGLIGHDHLDAGASGRLGIDAACNRAGRRQQPDELAGIEAGDLCHGLVQHVQHWHAQILRGGRLPPTEDGGADAAGAGRVMRPSMTDVIRPDVR